MTTETRMVKDDSCPVCGGRRFSTYYDKGERICSDCGCVVDDNFLDMRAAPSYDDKDTGHNGSRMDILRHDKGLSTDISMSDRDCNGKRLDYRTRTQFIKLRKIHQHTRIANAMQRGLVTALEEIRRVGGAMSLPAKAEEDAAMLYRRAMRKNLIHGRTVDGIADACLYTACRTGGIPRTLKEFAANTRFTSTELGRLYRLVSRSLKIRVTVSKPRDYIPRFCSNLSLGVKTQMYATDIIGRYEEKGRISGKGPTGVAAAAIYLATIVCNERRTQRSVAQACGVTEVTIRTRFNDMMDVLGMRTEVRDDGDHHTEGRVTVGAVC